ncbi:MAG: ankyrin repeat domain-containing protein [Desulfobacteraceae bacterium]|nr:ankyrin repeat domain-containing protein [Desulfobacteraceae bacterium]
MNKRLDPSGSTPQKNYTWSCNIQQIEKLCKHLFLTFDLVKELLLLEIQVYTAPKYSEVSFQPMNKLIIGVIRMELDRYGRWGVFQWHHHKGRAKFVSGKLRTMKSLDQVKKYLEREQGMLFGTKYDAVTLGNHYNNRSMKDKNVTGDYAGILKDGIQLVEKYKNSSENEKYQYYLENNIIKKSYHQTAFFLYLAVIEGHPGVVERLLKSGLDINQTYLSMTPLYVACMFGRTRVVKILLENKADINIRTDKGETPLFASYNCANDSITQMLLGGGAKKATKGYIVYRQGGG